MCETIISFTIAIMVNVVSYFVCKWLDSDNK